MSVISSCSSGVSKFSTGREASSRRGSPIRKTVLIAIDQRHLIENSLHPLHHALRHGLELLYVDSLCTGPTAGSLIDDYRNGRITEAQLASERRLRHSGHAYHVGSVALEPADLGGSLQAWPL